MEFSDFVLKIMQIYPAIFAKFIRESQKMLLHFSADFDFFLFVSSARATLGTPNFYTEFEILTQMLIFANFISNHTKCFFSFICWPVLIVFASSGRASWGTQNFYTEFSNFMSKIIYANLCCWFCM